MEDRLLSIVQSLYEAIGWPGVMLLMAVESACIPFPSEIIMPFAGWFLVKKQASGIEGVALIALAGAVGNLLGSLVAYYAGMIGGRPFLEKYGRYFLISQHELNLADRWFAKYGEWIVLVSRLMPVVRTFISLPAGIARMHVIRFSVFTLVGAYPFCFALAYGGYILWEHWEKLREAMRPFDIPILIVIVLAGLWYLWHRYKRVSRERA
ncbi:MAG: rane protein DedA, SNARE-associated domain [Dehalococcoidia bacterium]|nr:rane protein DedA, SNARE-associated domain [Dehalococcoidia bacterium]